MKKSIALVALVITLLWSCQNSPTQHIAAVRGNSSIQQDFMLEVNRLYQDYEGFQHLPFVQSGAYAQLGDTIILFGGRTAGFHGMSEGDTTFSKLEANTSIIMIDLGTNTYKELPLDQSDASLLQLSASNYEFVQHGDRFYLVGGYGRETTASEASDYTFDQLMVIDLRALIHEINRGSSGNPHKGIVATYNSPYLQVTGGHMVLHEGHFYILFGQNFPGVYNEKNNFGKYTNAIRRFRWDGSAITDTLSVVDSNLHRRDLNVHEVVQDGETFYAAYGGVFTDIGTGYLNPIEMHFEYPKIEWKIDTLKQLTNNYDCAIVSIYDAEENINYQGIIGGIGAFRWNEKIKKLVPGYQGDPLPFVKTISQMVWQNDEVAQFIQTPPQPIMSDYIGANAMFIPKAELLYEDGIIDYSKLGDTTELGMVAGGIIATAHTASSMYPSSLNTYLYGVRLIKLKK